MSLMYNDFLDFSRQQTSAGHKLALATIIETMGSSYQKAGARMIISSSGQYSGILAGGCFEGDFIEQSAEVFETGKPKTLFYDMRSSDDAIWGLGLGCNGAVRLFVQSLSEQEDFSPLTELAEAATCGNTAILCTVTDSELEELPTGTTFSWILGGSVAFTLPLHQSIYAHTFKALENKRHAYQTIYVQNKSLTVFCEKILPPKHLLLLGAGPDAIPLVNMASELRWDITLADHRPAYLIPERFPENVNLVSITPETIHDDLSLERFDAMVLMTHSIDYDIRYLKQLADSPLPYIGLLGPSHRRDELFKALGDKAELIRGRSHGPVGLNIGSRTPDEIALSILAEIQAVGTCSDGKMLDDSPLHAHNKHQQSITIDADCHAIILAAGESSRMGQPKQLLEFHGKPLILHTCEQLVQVFSERFHVVLGANSELIQQSLGSFQQQVVHNPDWQEGIASSIRAGLRALPKSARCVMIVLADQPLITTHILSRLLEKWISNPDCRIASLYESAMGVPAIFPRKDFDQLMQLTGDQGAKLLLNEATNVKAVLMPEAAIDLDTDEDYQNISAVSAW